MRQEQHTKEIVLTPRGVVAKNIALVAAIGAGVFGLHELDKSAERGEISTENCVSELVGKEINLERNPEDQTLQIPESVYSEQIACMRNGNDSRLAKEELDRN